MDRLTSMRVFATAVHVGSLSGAARQWHMSPAMAAKHVDALEARLGEAGAAAAPASAAATAPSSSTASSRASRCWRCWWP